jgi:hypothetical protein
VDAGDSSLEPGADIPTKEYEPQSGTAGPVLRSVQFAGGMANTLLEDSLQLLWPALGQ